MTIEINLIPQKTRQQRWGKPVALVGAALFILILSVLLFLYFQQLHEKNQANLMLQSSQALLQKVNAEDSIHSSDRLALQAKVILLQKNETHAKVLLMNIVGLLPANSTLSNFDYSNGLVTLTGEFNGLDDIASFEHALQGDSLAASVTLNQINSDSSTQLSANFTIQLNEAAYQALGGTH